MVAVQMELDQQRVELSRSQGRFIADLRTRDDSIVVPINYVVASTTSELLDVAHAMNANGICAIDTETTGLAWTDRVVLTGIYTGGVGYLIPHRMSNMENAITAEFKRIIGPSLESMHIKKVFHNAKFDLHKINQTFGIEVGGLHHDTSIAQWVLNENESHNLGNVCELWLGMKNWKIKQDGSFWAYPKNTAMFYAGRDIEATMKLYEFQVEHFAKLPKLKALFDDIEMPFIYLAYEMEKRGIAWDQQYYEDVMKPSVFNSMMEARAAVQEYTGEINLASPQQVSRFLYGTLSLPRLNEAKPNSVDKRMLAKLRPHHPVVRQIETERKFATIWKMAVKTLPDYVYNGRIHANINTMGTRTGRVSCSEPNLQQVPKASVGPIIRRAFVPSPGNVLVAMDYSQIELRILAYLSGDKALVEAFQADKDIHSAVAHEMLGTSWEILERDKDHRSRVIAKSINFGLLYGMGEDKLADTINGQRKDDDDSPLMTRMDSKRYTAAYFEKLPGVRMYIEETKKLAHRQAYVETLLGRKRRLPDIDSHKRGLVAYTERQAVNSRIQGSAADMFKKAALDKDKLIKEHHWPYALLLQVHDEFIYEVPRAWLKANRNTLDLLTATMAGAVPLGQIPVKVSVDILDRWGDKAYLDDEEVEDIDG